MKRSGLASMQALMPCYRCWKRTQAVTSAPRAKPEQTDSSLPKCMKYRKLQVLEFQSWSSAYIQKTLSKTERWNEMEKKYVPSVVYRREKDHSDFALVGKCFSRKTYSERKRRIENYISRNERSTLRKNYNNVRTWVWKLPGSEMK